MMVSATTTNAKEIKENKGNKGITRKALGMQIKTLLTLMIVRGFRMQKRVEAEAKKMFSFETNYHSGAVCDFPTTLNSLLQG